MRCEDYPCCGHTDLDPCAPQPYDRPGYFDGHLMCEHEHGFCEQEDFECDDEDCAATGTCTC